MYLQKVISKKIVFVGVLKVKNERQDPDPDPLVRGADPDPCQDVADPQH
jgi:hypothetical protein